MDASPGSSHAYELILDKQFFLKNIHTQTTLSLTHTHTHTHTHHDIDDSEVFLEPMANEFDSSLQQVDELEVAGLECGEVLGAHGSIEVAWLDP